MVTAEQQAAVDQLVLLSQHQTAEYAAATTLPIGGFTRPVAPSAFVDSAVAAAEQEELVLTGESVEGSDEECHEECVEVEVHAAGDEERDEDAFHMEVEEPGALDDAQIFAPISSSTPHEPPARDEETPLPEAASRKRKLDRLASSADSLPRSPKPLRPAAQVASPARRGLQLHLRAMQLYPL